MSCALVLGHCSRFLLIEATSVETFLLVQGERIKLIAATPSAQLEFTDANLTEGIAIVVGTEQFGLSETWMKAADLKCEFLSRVPDARRGRLSFSMSSTAMTLILYDNHILVVSSLPYQSRPWQIEGIAKLLASRKSMILAPVARTRTAGSVGGGESILG